MLQIIINALSFSFQIAGAILLLLWSLRKCNKKIRNMSVNIGVNIFDFQGKTDVDAKTLQYNAKVVYANIAAFIDIVIGYSLAIFADEYDINPWLMFFVVTVSTTIIIVIEKLSIRCVSILKFSKDEKMKPDNI